MEELKMNEITKVTETTNQTPIEIALGIDEDGMTTASRLYNFLELHPSAFSRWCTKNIKNNKFASENRDYIIFNTYVEKSKGRPKIDYKLTTDFAKKLSMTGNTERHEQARKYFIACEQGLKAAVQKNQSVQANLNQITDVISDLTKSLTSLTENMTSIQQDIQELKQAERNRYSFKNRYPSAWFKKMSLKYDLLQKYFNCTRNELYSNLYKELEDTYNIDINKIYEDYCCKNHLYRNECYPMDAIEHNDELKNNLTQLVDSNLIKYGIMTTEQIEKFKRITLFDTPPKTETDYTENK